MKLTTVLSLAPLLGAATAQGGQQQQQEPFTLNVRWSNSMGTLKGPLNANAGAFWIGKPIGSFCPENVKDCPSVNTTSFVAQGSKLFLNAAVPGGQQVYISPQGQLTYTIPHSGYIPDGSLTDLPIMKDGFLNPFLTLWLCADDKDAKQWRVWAEYTNGTTGAITNNGSKGQNACTRFALEAQEYKGDKAWGF